MYIDNKTVKDEDTIHITGYHGTIEEYAPLIEENGFDPKFSKKRDDHWLGQGVYFFDKEDLATWWAKNVQKNFYDKCNILCDTVVYTVDIAVHKNQYSDLDSYLKISEFWRFLLESIEYFNKLPFAFGIKLHEKNISKVRATFFDKYKETYNYLVLKKTFSKSQASYIASASNKIVDFLAKALNVFILEPQYCVSSKNCIEIKNKINVVNGDEYL